MSIYINKSNTHELQLVVITSLATLQAANEQEKFDKISNKMTSWREHPQPAENLVEMIRMTENGDDQELEHRFQSSRSVSILSCT